MSYISLKDICFAYDKTPVLKHFSLEIEKGEFVVIKGDNGSGKSTLLNIINGLLFQEIGEYYFDGEKISEKSLKNDVFSKNFHQKIGYVFQNIDAQLFTASVYDEIAFGPLQMGLKNDEIKSRVDDMLAFLNIENLSEKPPYQLSMGEKKKVALASVLSPNPQVIILDEPLNFLDKKTQNFITEFLKNLKSHKTIIIVTHSDEFDFLADKIVEI